MDTLLAQSKFPRVKQSEQQASKDGNGTTEYLRPWKHFTYSAIEQRHEYHHALQRVANGGGYGTYKKAGSWYMNK